MYPPKVKPYKPIGEWNQVLLIVNHNKVTQLLNGKVVVEYEKYSDEWKQLRSSGKQRDYPDYGKLDEGHIALQNHGTKVFYGNIELTELLTINFLIMTIKNKSRREFVKKTIS